MCLCVCVCGEMNLEHTHIHMHTDTHAIINSILGNHKLISFNVTVPIKTKNIIRNISSEIKETIANQGVNR